MGTITRLNKSKDKDRVAELFNSTILPECDEMFVVGQKMNGELVWDGFGMSAADLLWALEKCKHDILFGE